MFVVRSGGKELKHKLRRRGQLKFPLKPGVEYWLGVRLEGRAAHRRKVEHGMPFFSLGVFISENPEIDFGGRKVPLYPTSPNE